MHRILSVAAAVVVVVASFMTFAGTAEGHERRNVGPYQLVVGFLNEPALAGESNGLDLRVSDTRSNKAVEGLEKTLAAEVQSGGLSPMPLAVTARFGVPGAYSGYFVPTAKGTYIFHIKGKVEAQDVDEKFESGPGRFNDVESMTGLQYPTKVPTGDELGDRLAAIQSDLGQIRILAAVGIAIAIVALGAPFVMRRRA